MSAVDANIVRGALLRDVARILEAHGIRYRRRGRELRTHDCPQCGRRSRDAVCVNIMSGLWCCKAHGCAGDVFDLVAGYADLDVEREYPRVLELGATIAGVTGHVDPDLEQRLIERRQREVERIAREEARRKAAREAMPSTWEVLDRRSLVGERYLLNRGIDPVALRARGDVVRFTRAGEPAVALRELATGAIVGVQRRRVDGTEPKTPMLFGSLAHGAALHGRLADVDPDGPDVAVLVEGLADTLAAYLAFPSCAIFGAAGNEHSETIARALALRVSACRGTLLVVPHDDAAGVAAGVAAVRAAIAAELVVDRDLLVVDIGEHKDLADAWRAGWRWTWAQRAGGAA